MTSKARSDVTASNTDVGAMNKDTLAAIEKASQRTPEEIQKLFYEY